MPYYRTTITRDLSESAQVYVEAPSADKAAEIAISRDMECRMTDLNRFSLDENGNVGETYLPDPDDIEKVSEEEYRKNAEAFGEWDFIVIGRIPFDDEDTCHIIRCNNDDDAVKEFVRRIYEERKMKEPEDDSDRAFVNHILRAPPNSAKLLYEVA
ncbi:hypothetical protein [Thioalkalivibrio thiocyanodenitrificans]|uniref:hypothetical protein n=1 Tax=Thioalkalivibrio thiocyanodenitrificans TaxID=243063 RepID=UPI000365854A|nr:hypothetical protein [Thioalkalivibrio thiocyanodenitrificans]